MVFVCDNIISRKSYSLVIYKLLYIYFLIYLISDSDVANQSHLGEYKLFLNNIDLL